MPIKIFILSFLLLSLYALNPSSRGSLVLETSISYLVFDGSIENNTALIQPSGTNLHILGRKSNLIINIRSCFFRISFN